MSKEVSPVVTGLLLDALLKTFRLRHCSGLNSTRWCEWVKEEAMKVLKEEAYWDAQYEPRVFHESRKRKQLEQLNQLEQVKQWRQRIREQQKLLDRLEQQKQKQEQQTLMP